MSMSLRRAIISPQRAQFASVLARSTQLAVRAPGVRFASRVSSTRLTPLLSSSSVSRWTPLATRGVRRFSVLEEEAQAPIVGFEKVKEIAEKQDPEVVIVDVREPQEYAQGYIPGAVNIPVKSSPGALGLSEEEFQLTFGIPKPDPSKTLLFYCLAGVRSSMSEELAGTFGYKKRLNYVGSWEDWVANNGKVAIPEPSTEESN